jgi:sugar phosphate isomerase/epimerase
MALSLAYQIYSAREDAERDLNHVLHELSAIGYNGVEFAGFYGLDAQDVKKMLQEHHLVPLSSHVQFNLIKADMENVIAYHKQIGIQYIAVPAVSSDEAPGKPGYAASICTISTFGKMCAENGIQLIYHNHDTEFVKISGQYALDFLYDAIQPVYLATELDTCWIDAAGESSVEYIKKYKGRCSVVHLKDYTGVKGMDFKFCPVGYGKMDIAAILEAGNSSGVQWYIVEQDRSTQRTPLEDARMSYDYIRQLERQLKS